ncbi:hypothetical protein [Allokutzneria albata]|uniref:Uncharacterized protein n=1 Tax=Allokutzneria albata TaxID=211114 RepID=A0A1G9W1X4_ALLAB|nr:hypothetical protein [Allokutzneria albata]SDM78055.1 hypothetical protein SAMN04489726_3336 [Allokutzneria albata]
MPLCEAKYGDVWSTVPYPMATIIGEVHLRKTRYGIGWSIVHFRDCTPI